MTKIYVATDGEYSDYHINAVFIDRGIADAFIAKHGGKIKEFDSLDTIEAFTGPPGKRFFTVVMYRNGDTKCGAQEWDTFAYYNEPPLVREFINLQHWQERAFMESGCWADDAQHAIKIVNEQRTKLIAENRFPETLEEMKAMEGAVFTP